MKLLAYVTLTNGTSFGVHVEGDNACEVAARIGREGVTRGSYKPADHYKVAEFYAAHLISKVQVEEV